MELKAKITKDIKDLKASEKISKALLSVLSRDLLKYVPDTADIGMVNRLLGVLTPMNKKTAILYFKKYLEWNYEQEGENFSGKVKGDKKVAAIVELRDIWLADPDNDIWVFAATLKVEPKQVDYGKKITDDINNAMDEGKGNMLASEVMDAITASNLTVHDLIAAATAMAPEAANAA